MIEDICINKKDIIDAYKNRTGHKNEGNPPRTLQKVKHLSDESYETYACVLDNRKEEKAYYIYNTSENEFIVRLGEDIKPKSVRERLHNIQENKRFYERTQTYK